MAYGVSMQRFARHRLVRIPLAGAGALILLGAAAGPSIAVDKWVTMYNSKYLPGVVTIEPGDTVTWVNDDDLPHDAAGSGWSTPLLMKGDSARVTFARAGTYRYSCTIHPEMRSAVIVRAGGAAAPPSDTAAAVPVSSTGPAPAAVLAIVGSAAIAFYIAIRRTARPGR
jgi:plastocyanin